MKIIIEIKSNKEIGGVDVTTERVGQLTCTQTEMVFAEAFQESFEELMQKLLIKTRSKSMTNVRNQ